MDAREFFKNKGSGDGHHYRRNDGGMDDDGTPLVPLDGWHVITGPRGEQFPPQSFPGDLRTSLDEERRAMMDLVSMLADGGNAHQQHFASSSSSSSSR